MSFKTNFIFGMYLLSTAGETIVGPIKTLFMDEISNGLDSSTTFQIVSCLRHYALLSEGTIVVSLLQPAPETFELFDDVILMGEGKIIYIGPRDYICRFFEDCGFKYPTRKSVAEFLQEVISRKDQEQYWCHIDKPYCYVSIDSFIERFKKSELGLQQQEELSKTHDKSQAQKDALCSSKYSLSNWEMLKACSRREFLLMKRNSFVYVFKSGLVSSCIFFTRKSILVLTITCLNLFYPFNAVDLHWIYYNDRLSKDWV